MKVKLLVFLSATLLLFFLGSANIAQAATCSPANCSGSCSGPMWNGNTCQTQGKYCSAGQCVCGWSHGVIQPPSSCGCRAGNGTSNVSCGNTQTSCSCNDSTCQTQGYQCSSNQCVSEWALGSTCAQSSCNGGAGCVARSPSPTPGNGNGGNSGNGGNGRPTPTPKPTSTPLPQPTPVPVFCMLFPFLCK